MSIRPRVSAALATRCDVMLGMPPPDGGVVKMGNGRGAPTAPHPLPAARSPMHPRTASFHADIARRCRRATRGKARLPSAPQRSAAPPGHRLWRNRRHRAGVGKLMAPARRSRRCAAPHRSPWHAPTRSAPRPGSPPRKPVVVAEIAARGARDRGALQCRQGQRPLDASLDAGMVDYEAPARQCFVSTRV